MLINNVAIVTGANREIGAAMAEALAAQGCAVLASGYGEPARTEALAARIRAAGGIVEAHESDLATPQANADLVAYAVSRFGRVDILAANAGLTIARPLLETDEAMWDTLFDLNLKGAFFAAQAAARQMIAQGSGGRIVFSSSVTGMRACRNLGAYGVTKAALMHLARVMALELGVDDITVNALGIGAIDNERNRRDDPHYDRSWAPITPTGRVGRPEDVAGALMLLVSPAAAHITGQTLVVDGGWTMTSPLPG
jgi:3-oxoacyl-[acyl-carrier protein] reductase